MARNQQNKQQAPTRAEDPGLIIAVSQAPASINIPHFVTYDGPSGRCRWEGDHVPIDDLTSDARRKRAPKQGAYLSRELMHTIKLDRGIQFLGVRASSWRLLGSAPHDPHATTKNLPKNSVGVRHTVPWALEYVDGKVDMAEQQRRLFAALEWARTDTEWSRNGSMFKSNRFNRVPQVCLLRLTAGKGRRSGDVQFVLEDLRGALDTSEVLDVITKTGAAFARASDSYAHLGVLHDWAIENGRGDLAVKCRQRGQKFRKAG